MSSLAPPPLARSRIVAPSETELSAVPFFGRSLSEYVQFFALDLHSLRARDVLDVASGPSSFTAEACARRINAVAVDPLYGCKPEALATHVQLDYAAAFAQMRATPQRLKSFPSLEAAELDRRTAAQRFLADYEAHFIHNRYVGASLPRLPFFDGTFDLVLCAHLLFTSAKHLDFDWHLAACRELVRVAAEEVRIYPVSGANGKPSPGLSRLRRVLKESGVACEVRPVDYELPADATSMLVLRKAAS